MKTTLRKILTDAGFSCGRLEAAVVDDETIHRLNREYLGHDYPTDVLAFELESDAAEGLLEGSVIVSAQMASARAEEFGWTPADELALYMIHGTLHLVGYDDHETGKKRQMRRKEKLYHDFWQGRE